jgi:hypothetical protein
MTIVTYPPTWVVFAVVAVAEIGTAVWFQPPAAVLVLAIGAGAILLILWPFLLVRSPEFEELLDRSRHAYSMEAFASRLEGSYPSFAPAATDCWAIAERIRGEFGAEGFGREVDLALEKLIKLTESHVKFYARSRQFGDSEQKKEMEVRLLKQVDHVENTRTSLLRLGGHLTILHLDTAGREEIGNELKSINRGLEEAVRELDEILTI